MGGQIPILYGKKRAFNKTANYLISLEKTAKDRGTDLCVGKLRANNENDKFNLYDNGENFSRLNKI